MTSRDIAFQSKLSRYFCLTRKKERVRKERHVPGILLFADSRERERKEGKWEKEKEKKMYRRREGEKQRERETECIKDSG